MVRGAQRVRVLRSQDAPPRRQRGPVNCHRLGVLALVSKRTAEQSGGLERARVARPVQALLRGQDAAQQRLGLGVVAHRGKHARQVGRARQRVRALLLVWGRRRQTLPVQRRRLGGPALPLQHIGEGAGRGAGVRVAPPKHPAADRQHVPQQRLRLVELARLKQRLAQVPTRE